MAVLGILAFTLEVPDVKAGVKFYSDAGLLASTDGQRARFRCVEQDRDSILLVGGADRKRLHHVSLRAEHLAEMERKVSANGGKVVDAPPGFETDGLWILDPHGMRIHLRELAADSELSAPPRYEINAPGRIVRTRRSAVLPSAQYRPVQPRRLGHIVVFTPDVMESVRFVTDALGMGLADRAQEVIAFCCARRNSDHHVLGFGKSAEIGFHHASFQVNDPDEVGRAGRALAEKSGKGEWGFGRHTIGSNFFHYVQDPWGSWFEYYSDIDFIDDYALWTPTNYELQDGMASWGPPLPADFAQNYEALSAV